MDPLSALSIAATVVQFLGVGLKIMERLSEYNNSGPNDVIRSLHGISTLLPLVLNSLSRIQTEADIDSLDMEARCILRGVVSGCFKLIDEIDDILEKLSRTPGESVAVKIRKVLISFKYEDRALKIAKNLQTYIHVLILHHVIDAKEVSTSPIDETKYFSVPEKNVKNFVKPEKVIKALDAAFNDVMNFQQTVPQLMVLSGGPGFGKSQLACCYCYEKYQENQFQSVFWLKGSSPESLVLSLEGVAAVVRCSSKGSRADKVSFTLEFLSERWHPWLLVVDDYVPKSFDGTDIMTMLPQRGYGAIILTTRYNVTFGASIRVSKYISMAEKTYISKRLTAAIESNDFPTVKRCIEDGLHVNHVNAHNEYPVIQAASKGFHEAVSYLLRAGAYPKPPLGNSVLFEAAAKGHITVLEALLDFEDEKKGFAEQSEYDAAFKKALGDGHAAICRLIIARRDVRLNPDKFVNIVRSGRLESVKFYVEEGILPEDESQWKFAMKNAIWYNHDEIFRYLLGTYPTLVNSIGSSMLASAAEHKRTELVRLLLTNGCDPNLPGDDGNLPLAEAVYQDEEELTRTLLENGADPSLDSKTSGRQIIIRAHRGHYSKATSMLLATPLTDRNRRRRLLQKCMNRAVEDGSNHLVVEVLESADRAGEDYDIFDILDADGCTLLLRALSRYGDLKLARILIRRNFRLDGTAGESEDSALHTAAREGYDGIARLLLEKKMDTAIKNRFGNTPLHLAAARGHQEVVKLLLKWEADTELENKLGETSFDMAEEAGHKDIALILKERTEI